MRPSLPDASFATDASRHELELRNAQLAMQIRAGNASLDLMAKVFTHIDEAVVITDPEARILMVNPAFTRLTGYALDEVVGLDPKVLSAGRTSREVYGEMWQSLADQGSWQGELWDRRKSGEDYPKWLSIVAVKDAEGVLTHYIGTFTDISERKAAEQRILHLAHHDALTQLPNRLNLQQRFEQALLLAQRHDKRLALMLIDLDRFKAINDTLGHHVGDQLLIEVAARLRAAVRESDIVARLGGDEFVVVVTDVGEAEAAAQVAHKLVDSLSVPYLIGGDLLRTSPSIGVSLQPDDGNDLGELLKSADVAMYFAKSQGRNQYQFFSAGLQENAVRRMTMEADLSLALERQEFELHYQPQLDLATGGICGVEALLRWRHPSAGLVPPLDFIPVAEESGLIGQIGDWVLSTAIAQQAIWRAQGIDLQVSVNLSPSQFRDHRLPRRIAELLDSHRRSGAPALDLEITESMSMHAPEDAIEQMRALTADGVTLSMDDFGTGYSSLAYLKLFPIRTLKIDRSFVKDIETDADDATICDVTVLLAHKMGLEVIAEGVETAGQLKYLLSIGCEKVQGFLISKAIPADEIAPFIRSHQPLPWLGSVELWS